MNSPLWPEMVLVQDFMPVFVVCKFEEGPIKTEGDSVSIFFSAQEQVTRKSKDGCVQNSNSFELLWLSSLPASLMAEREEL